MKLAIVGNKSIEKYDISYKSFCDQLEFIFHNDELRPPIQLYQVAPKASTHLQKNSHMIMA